MINQELKKNMIKNKLDYSLKEGFLRSKNLIYTLRDGNLKYTILYLKSEKKLKVYCLVGNYYSSLVLEIPYNRLNKGIKIYLKELGK